MPEYVFFLTRIFPVKDRIFDLAFARENTSQRKPYTGIFFFDSVLRQEYMGQRKPSFWHFTQ